MDNELDTTAAKENRQVTHKHRGKKEKTNSMVMRITKIA